MPCVCSLDSSILGDFRQNIHPLPGIQLLIFARLSSCSPTLQVIERLESSRSSWGGTRDKPKNVCVEANS